MKGIDEYLNVSKTEGRALFSEYDANQQFYLKMYILREEKIFILLQEKVRLFSLRSFDPMWQMRLRYNFETLLANAKLWPQQTANKVKSEQHEKYFFSWTQTLYRNQELQMLSPATATCEGKVWLLVIVVLKSR